MLLSLFEMGLTFFFFPPLFNSMLNNSWVLNETAQDSTCLSAW